jgi:hypothetical protein
MIIGIDPGRKTALVLLDEQGKPVDAICVDAPDGIARAEEWASGHIYQWVVVEDQYVGPGLRASIQLAQYAGMIAWAIGPGRGKQLMWIPPRTWQCATWRPTRGGSTKKAAALAARGIFGECCLLTNEHLRDAALIAHYAWRRQRGV